MPANTRTRSAADDPTPGETTASTAASGLVRQPLSPELAWRVDAMRPQMTVTGAIPYLRARPDELFSHDVCVSCGDPLPDIRPRCRLCSDAANIVLGEHR